MSKTFDQITKNEKYAIRNKTNKNGKYPVTTNCFGCKKFLHNFRPQEVKMMTNKVLREKSSCVVCRSNKSRLLKPKLNNKK